jgi:hypothetical protein
MARPFMSHSTADKVFVAGWLEPKLRDLGHHPWLDDHAIPPGAPIPSTVGEGMQTCDFLILVLSKAALASDWVRREIDTWLMRDAKVGAYTLLPIRIEECDPPEMIKALRFLDFFPEERWPVELARLHGRLNGSSPVGVAPTTAATPAPGNGLSLPQPLADRAVLMRATMWEHWRRNAREAESEGRSIYPGPHVTLHLRDGRKRRGYVPHFMRLDVTRNEFVVDYTDGEAVLVKRDTDDEGSRVFVEDILDITASAPASNPFLGMPRSILPRRR